MSEPRVPPTPPPPPTYTPPPSAESPNRKIMLVLSYFGILALIPLLVEKEDREVQWHAKNGMVLAITEIITGVALMIVGHIPGLNCIGCLIWPIVGIIFLVLSILCIVKALNGERFIIPVLSQYTDRF
jgi:uncharacterized membrane protein